MPRQPYTQRPRRSSRIAWALGFAIIALLVLTAIGVTAHASGLLGHWTSPAQKQAALAQSATQQTQEANAHAKATKGPFVNPPSSCPAPTVVTGVMPQGLGGAGFKEMYTSNTANAYPTEQSQGRYTIAAGSLLSNQQQSVIGVLRLATDPCLPGHPPTALNYYPAPFQGGALTLTKLQGDVVWFTAADGATGSFNFVTDKYL